MLKLRALAKEWQLAFFIFIPSLFHLGAGATSTPPTNHLELTDLQKHFHLFGVLSSLRGRTCREELNKVHGR